ncbi:hypothetical protein [Actinomadura yumaensis]|uniref:Uncharacterized protein n=1 Tax=Actinomadura yumaensis TaxID=111807 RepID=A0ABW2CRZ8_9ACTN
MSKPYGGIIPGGHPHVRCSAGSAMSRNHLSQAEPRSPYWARGSCPECGKTRYASRREAKKAARKLYPGAHMQAYPCGVFFHVGNTPRSISSGVPDGPCQWPDLRAFETASQARRVLADARDAAEAEGRPEPNVRVVPCQAGHWHVVDRRKTRRARHRTTPTVLSVASSGGDRR